LIQLLINVESTLPTVYIPSQPVIAQDPHAVAPVEPPATLNAPEPAEPEAIITEALVDEPPSYFVESMAESIKDFEPVGHVPTTDEVVPENATPNLGHRMEPEAHDDDDAVPVATIERDTQQITEPMIPMPIQLRQAFLLHEHGSEVWGGDPSSSVMSSFQVLKKMSSRLKGVRRRALGSLTYSFLRILDPKLKAPI
jgi:hypothetical protein